MDETSLAKDLTSKPVHLMNDWRRCTRLGVAHRRPDHDQRGHAGSARPDRYHRAGNEGWASRFFTWDGLGLVAHGLGRRHSISRHRRAARISITSIPAARLGPRGVERVCSGIGVQIFTNFCATRKVAEKTDSRAGNRRRQGPHEAIGRGRPSTLTIQRAVAGQRWNVGAIMAGEAAPCT